MSIGTAALALCMTNAVAIYDSTGHTIEVVCFPDPNGVNGGPGAIFDVARSDANDQVLLSNIDFRIVEWAQSSTLNLLEDDYETFFTVHGFTPRFDYFFGSKPFYWVGNELWVFTTYEPVSTSSDQTTLLKFDAASRALVDTVTIGPVGVSPWAQASWDNNTFYWVNQEGNQNTTVNNSQPFALASLYRWTVGDPDATFVANLSALVARDPATFAGDIRTIAMRGPSELVALSEGGEPGPPFLAHSVVQCFDVSGGGCTPTARYEYGDMVTSGALESFYPKLALAGHQNTISVFGCAADDRYIYVVDEGGGEIYRIDRVTDNIVLWNQDLYTDDVFAKGNPRISTGPTNGEFLGLNARDFAGYVVPVAPDAFRLWPVSPPNLTGAFGGATAYFDA